MFGNCFSLVWSNFFIYYLFLFLFLFAINKPRNPQSTTIESTKIQPLTPRPTSNNPTNHCKTPHPITSQTLTKTHHDPPCNHQYALHKPRTKQPHKPRIWTPKPITGNLTNPKPKPATPKPSQLDLRKKKKKTQKPSWVGCSPTAPRLAMLHRR